MRRLIPIAGLVLAACGGDEGSRQAQNVGPAERQIIGMADPYPADDTMRAREDLLRSSMAARREMAWGVVAKVLAPVKLASKEIDLLEEGQLDVEPSIPRFETWYQKDELKRMFHHLYKAQGVEARKAKAPLSDASLESVFEWNAHYLAEEGLPEDLYTGRLAKLKEEADLDGLTAGEAISYSPALAMHFFQNYRSILDCVRPVSKDSSATLLDLVKPSDPPISEESNFTLCYESEFPIDAAIAKSFWSNSIVDPALRTYDTSAAAMSAHLHEGDGGWGNGDGKATPGKDEIHSARLIDGTTLRLAGLHIVTKELRHWVWITLWWSPEPDRDFGADRPEAIRALGGPWSHYKMSVVIDFEERDPDPRGGAPIQAVSLGDALAATHGGPNGPTWTSNAYLEEGPMNARSNCMGCHQHAGTPIDPLAILFDESKYPENGRALVRKNFPSDYMWVFDKKSRLARIIQSDVDFQDANDPE